MEKNEELEKGKKLKLDDQFVEIISFQVKYIYTFPVITKTNSEIL